MWRLQLSTISVCPLFLPGLIERLPWFSSLPWSQVWPWDWMLANGMWVQAVWRTFASSASVDLPGRRSFFPLLDQLDHASCRGQNCCLPGSPVTDAELPPSWGTYLAPLTGRQINFIVLWAAVLWGSFLNSSLAYSIKLLQKLFYKMSYCKVFNLSILNNQTI